VLSLGDSPSTCHVAPPHNGPLSARDERGRNGWMLPAKTKGVYIMFQKLNPINKSIMVPPDFSQQQLVFLYRSTLIIPIHALLANPEPCCA
jgi:hypothetical protein